MVQCFPQPRLYVVSQCFRFQHFQVGSFFQDVVFEIEGGSQEEFEIGVILSSRNL
jgi:hypothetical protein